MPIAIFFLSLIFSCFAFASNAEVESIDKQIEQLGKERDGHRAQALRWKNNADRWQFQNQLTEARKAWDEADRQNKKADELQVQIDALESKKAQIQERP